MAYSLLGEQPRAAASSPFPFAGFLPRWREAGLARRKRSALLSLLELDDHRLDDLGLNRQDLFEAIAKGNARAATVLNERRSARARSWLSQ